MIPSAFIWAKRSVCGGEMVPLPFLNSALMNLYAKKKMQKAIFPSSVESFQSPDYFLLLVLAEFPDLMVWIRMTCNGPFTLPLGGGGGETQEAIPHSVFPT